MDREDLAGLTAELRAQLRLIERVVVRLQDRVKQGFGSAAQLDSIAYQIHNLYCAVEDLLKLVAHAFENRIGSGGSWHRTLFLRLSQPVEGVRPVLLSEELFDVLNRLRGFRHFIRHGYGIDIELAQLQANLALAIQVQPLLINDVELFLVGIGSAADKEGTLP